MLHHDYPKCHPGCEPLKREQPPYCGKVNTASMGEYYSSHACPPSPPHPGYCIPPIKPLFVPGMSTQEQISLLAGKVDEMVNLLGKYDEKVWGAYDEIVNACICNDAYYSEIETEVGYLSATSAKYTVVHIPFVDRSNEPILLQLGLAYDNTTNSGLHENVFDASERKLADKLFPAFNIADKWSGKVYWKGAPLNSDDTTGFTVGVLKNGFIKVYNQTATTADMNKDGVENAMGVAGVLVSGGDKTPDNYGYTDGITGMVGLGMNYDTQERFFIMVDGEQATGVTSGGGCTADQLADLFKKYGCTVAVLLAYKESVCGLDCGEMLNIPYDTNHIPYVPQLNAYWYITKSEHYHNDYVREVAELMQKYGRSIWTGVINGKTLDAVRSELADVESQLSQEIQDRKDGDTALGQRIDTLGERVTTLYNELVEADTELGNRIDQEIADRQTAVADEAKARKEADKALEESGSTIAGKLDQEITDRETADTTINSRIDKEISDRQKAVNDEVATRTENDQALQDALDKLKTDYNAFKTSTTTDLETKTSQITQILADISAVKNVIAGVQATQSEIDETLTSIQGTLSTMEQSFENLKQTVANLQTSWEQYKTSMNSQWSEFQKTIEKSMSDMETSIKEWVSSQLGSYLPLAGTVDDAPVTGDIVFDTATANHKISGVGSIDMVAGTGDSAKTSTVEVVADEHGNNTVKITTNPVDTSETATNAVVPYEYVNITGENITGIAEYSGKTTYYSLNSSGLTLKEADDDNTYDFGTDGNKGQLRFSYGDSSTADLNPVVIKGVGTPVDDTDGVNKKYVDSNLGKYIPLSGSSQITGGLVTSGEYTDYGGLAVISKGHSEKIRIYSDRISFNSPSGNLTLFNAATTSSPVSGYGIAVCYEKNNRIGELAPLYAKTPDSILSDNVVVTRKLLYTYLKNYIPLTGTTTDNPVTGNISFKVDNVTSTDKFGIVGATHGDFRNYTKGLANTYFAYNTTPNGLYFNEVATSSGGYNGSHIKIDGIGSVGLTTGSTGSSSSVTSTIGITTDGYLQLTTNNPSGEAVGQLTVENNEINVHNNYITNVKDPVSDTDAVTKKYVDSIIKSRNSAVSGGAYNLVAGKTHTYGVNLVYSTEPTIYGLSIDLSDFVNKGVDIDNISASSFYAVTSTDNGYSVTQEARITNISSSELNIPDGAVVKFNLLLKN